MTTLKELAQILGLSPSTVSKCLNDSPEISDATKERVLKLADSYGYVPNNVARSLKLRRTKNIGVIVPNILDEFFGKVIHGIEKEASKRNYKIVIGLSNDQKKKEQESLSNFINGSVDGVLITLARETQQLNTYGHLNNAQLRQTPIVLFDRICDDVSCDKITVDDFEGAQKATQYLMDGGCKNIAFLSTISHTSVGEQRKKGYLQALSTQKDSNLSPIYILIDNYDSFEEGLKEALKSHKIDAILAIDELSAVCAINMLQLNGYKVPEDVAVIGFTNGQMAKYSNPPLTTISQHAENIGKNAVSTLIKRIENPGIRKHTHKVLKTELITRKSTRKPKTQAAN